MWIGGVEQIPGAPLESESEDAFEMLGDFGPNSLGIVEHEDANTYSRTNDVDEGLGTLTVTVLSPHRISLVYMVPAMSVPTRCPNGTAAPANASMVCTGTSR
jgi:hypothetical protein